jgi:hypothetical protein
MKETPTLDYSPQARPAPLSPKLLGLVLAAAGQCALQYFLRRGEMLHGWAPTAFDGVLLFVVPSLAGFLAYALIATKISRRLFRSVPARAIFVVFTATLLSALAFFYSMLICARELG